MVVALIGLSLTIIPAQASIFDWLSNTEDTVPPGSSYSLVFADSQFGIGKFLKTDKGEGEADLMTLGSGFIIAANAHEKAAVVKKVEKITEMFVVATAYSSTPDQTDDSPFITAQGTYVRDGIVAANFLPFGTRIRIPDIYGDKIFEVEDRMNRRYWHRVDVWFPDRQTALEFGIKTIKIHILES